jgi:(1->4)-alpha-D-glucan 1-alpha-D-glucosylmutase
MRLLAELEAHGAPHPAAARALLQNLEDSRAKLYVTWRALQFRKAHAALFDDGEYLLARVGGSQASHLCAYARRTTQEWALVIVPRLYARLMDESDELPLGTAVWGDTAIELPRRLAGTRMRNVLTGRDLAATPRDGGHWLAAADALEDFPVALAASAP